MLHDQFNLCIRVGDKLVNRHYCGHAVVLTQVVDVPVQVGKPRPQCRQVFLCQVLARDTTMKLQSTNGRDQHTGRRANARRAALDINKLFRP